MDKELNLNITANDGMVTLLTGKNFYTLEDKTSATFKTESIKSFASYVESAVNGNLAKVFYTRSAACCIPSEIDYNSSAIAQLTMRVSEPLQKIQSCIGELSPAKMDEFLTAMRPYFGNNMSDFRSKIRSTIVKTVTEAERTISDTGDYAFTVTRKGLGREELKIPETVELIVPVYELLEDVIALQFDTLFTFTETGDPKEPVRMVWGLRGLNLNEQIKDAQLKIMQKYFEPLTEKNCFYGELNIVPETDSWKYKESDGNLI